MYKTESTSQEGVSGKEGKISTNLRALKSKAEICDEIKCQVTCKLSSTCRHILYSQCRTNQTSSFQSRNQTTSLSPVTNLENPFLFIYL